jgi:hypothetical protein
MITGCEREATLAIRENLVGKQKRGIDLLVGTQSNSLDERVIYIQLRISNGNRGEAIWISLLLNGLRFQMWTI